MICNQGGGVGVSCQGIVASEERDVSTAVDMTNPGRGRVRGINSSHVMSSVVETSHMSSRLNGARGALGSAAWPVQEISRLQTPLVIYWKCMPYIEIFRFFIWK